MSICNKCNKPIEIRYKDGKFIPMHFDGGCTGISGNINENFAEGSQCIPTHCPACGSDVFFIRHNGGSVWLDSPLGWPWYKHPCFDSSEKSIINKSALIDYDISNLDYPDAEIGVVTGSFSESDHSNIWFETNSNDLNFTRVLVKWNASFLLGQLCFLNNAKIWPVDRPDLAYTVFKRADVNKSIAKAEAARKAEAAKKARIEQARVAREKAKEKARLVREIIESRSLDELTPKVITYFLKHSSFNSLEVHKRIIHELMNLYGVVRLCEIIPNKCEEDRKLVGQSYKDANSNFNSSFNFVRKAISRARRLYEDSRRQNENNKKAKRPKKPKKSKKKSLKSGEG